ncbi:unnamed protein product [Oppiella nova]|uniref:Immunoglobulin domain-containing protein n=1 Tax=Oppiella nova TaxID=334625 RepID=A0A7R9M7D8_9ACAR|nr:unnamed protein product [Oppiella nova]CAG2170855.1 unnamed protein product [Oppiella nova]
MICKLLLNILLVIAVVVNDWVSCVTMGGFEAPNTVKAGDNLTLNCTVTFTPEERLNSEISMTKDGQEFYRFNRKSMNEELKSIPGIDSKQMDTPMNVPGWVRLKNANLHFQGTYACVVITNINNNLSEQSMNKYVTFDPSMGDYPKNGAPNSETEKPFHNQIWALIEGHKNVSLRVIPAKVNEEAVGFNRVFFEHLRCGRIAMFEPDYLTEFIKNVYCRKVTDIKWHMSPPIDYRESVIQWTDEPVVSEFEFSGRAIWWSNDPRL